MGHMGPAAAAQDCQVEEDASLGERMPLGALLFPFAHNGNKRK